MPPERPRPLRTQLLLWLVGPLVLLLAAEAAYDLHSAAKFSNRAYDKALVELTRDISSHVVATPAGARLELAPALRPILLADRVDRVFYTVADEAGAVLEGDAIPDPPGRRNGTPAAELLYDTAVAGADVRAAETRVDIAAGRSVRVRVAETLNKRNSLAHEIALSALLPQAVTVLLMVALVWIGVDRGLAPVEDLQRALALRSHRDRSPVPVGELPSELRPLVASINDLLARLDAVLTLQTRFIADAAHQLKTPVAGLKAQAELLLREQDAETRREVVGRLYVSAERLSRIVSQLLSLARNDPEAMSTQRLEPVDLRALALEITKGWVPHAIERGIDLGFEGAEAPVIVQAEPQALSDLLDNLLDNAIRYSRAGGRVTARVTGGAQPRLSVSDDAPRIPPGEHERVFERFHRLQHGTEDGSGLGLAIVREIARLHGAEIALAEDPDGEGNLFHVTFPPAQGL